MLDWGHAVLGGIVIALSSGVLGKIISNHDKLSKSDHRLLCDTQISSMKLYIREMKEEIIREIRGE